MPDKIQRRDFLILGSTGVASLVLGDGAMAALGRESSNAPPVSVGYWRNREEQLARDDDALEASPFRADVMGADRLRSGDDEFLSRGALVTIHGVVEAEKAWHRPELDALSVFACFGLPGSASGKTIRHQVWVLEKTPVVNRSAPVSFTIPVAEETGLRLAVGRYEGMQSAAGRYIKSRVYGVESRRDPAAASSQDVVLSMRPQNGSPALRRGVYFIAGLTHGGPAPSSWRGLQFRASEEGSDVRHRRLARRGLDEPSPADFDYLVLSVDYAA